MQTKLPPSVALGKLQVRLADIDDLMRAHTAVGGNARGRRHGVEGINRAAVVMLCAHLEGYIEDLFSEALRAIHPKLEATPLISRFHNPLPANIDSLFAAIGISKLCGSISWRGTNGKSVTDNLKDLVDTRNRIAHGVTDIEVSKAQVVRFQRYVVGFAKHLDEHVALHVLGMTRELPWTPATFVD